MSVPIYLLDTSILLHLARGQALGQYIEATFQLRRPIPEPRICVVSEGEIWCLAAQRKWGIRKRQNLDDLLGRVLILNINQPAVIAAYVDIDRACRAHPAGARVMGQNDMWIAAVAKVTGDILLTTDKDFDHLHPAHIQRIYIDPASTLPPLLGPTP